MTAQGQPVDPQIRFMRSVTTLYTDLFDRVCGRRGTEPDVDLSEASRLDQAVYMIWDMDGIGYAPQRGAHMAEACIDIFSNVLARCHANACHHSVLHGTGHLYRSEWSNNGQTRQRLEDLVDRFLATRTPPAWLREYALLARNGAVM